MKINNENKSDIMNIEKQSDKKSDEFIIMGETLKYFGFIKASSGF